MTNHNNNDRPDGADGRVSSDKILEFRHHEENNTALALRLGVNVKTITRWATANHRITLGTAERVAHALDLHPLLIWGTEYTNAVRATDPSEVLNQITNLTTLNAAKRCGVSEAAIERWRTLGVGTAATIENARRNLAAFRPVPSDPNMRKWHDQ